MSGRSGTASARRSTGPTSRPGAPRRPPARSSAPTITRGRRSSRVAWSARPTLQTGRPIAARSPSSRVCSRIRTAPGVCVRFAVARPDRRRRPSTAAGWWCRSTSAPIAAAARRRSTRSAPSSERGSGTRRGLAFIFVATIALLGSGCFGGSSHPSSTPPPTGAPSVEWTIRYPIGAAAETRQNRRRRLGRLPGDHRPAAGAPPREALLPVRAADRPRCGRVGGRPRPFRRGVARPLLRGQGRARRGRDADANQVVAAAILAHQWR
jgi:hypothetical protein